MAATGATASVALVGAEQLRGAIEDAVAAGIKLIVTPTEGMPVHDALAARRLERVLWNDPASGVMRHADAGYETAIACAREKGLDLPGILG